MPTLVYRDTGVISQIINENAPTTTYAVSASSCLLEATSATNVHRAFLQFPMVPPGGAVTVTSATLDLWNDNGSARATTRVVQAQRLVSAWTPAQTSWNNKATATPWAVAGVLGGAEASGVVMATGTFPTAAQTPFAMTGAGFLTYCQDILNGATDYGFILNLIDDQILTETGNRTLGGPTNATLTKRPTLTIEYTTGTPVNWTISSPTVNSDAGTATLVVTLDGPAPGGGFSGLVNTYDITAVAGVDYTAQVDVPFSISAGLTTGNIVIPILP
jgi:hypothetical protein